MKRPAWQADLAALAGYTALAVAWFWPVLAAGKLLAPGDGLIEALPSYLSPRTLWEPALGTGYPAAADPLSFTWYPPAILLSRIPGSFNTLILCAYVLAAWFTYLLVEALTGSRFAGWISGLLYGFSGFLMAHLGHPVMIHGAAWIPAVLLAVERLEGPRAGRWFAFGCFATACLVLAGHPQIMVYGLAIAGCYAAAQRRLRAAAMFACGIGMGAVLLLPEWELTRMTAREHLSFESFNEYHLPLRNLILLLFPFLYGGETGSIYGDRIVADTEQDAFLGLCALLLAAVALVKPEKRAPVRFFAAAAAVALVCALGGETIAGHVVFHVPLFNRFRCQERWLLLFQLAMAVLAGFGVRALIVSAEARRKAVRIAAVLLLIEFAGAFAIAYWFAGRLHAWAAPMGFPDSRFDLGTPAVFVPLLAGAAVLAAVIVFEVLSRDRKGAVFGLAALSLAAIFELATFGVFASWRYYSPSRSELERPATASLVKGARFATVRGFLGQRAELPPNLSRLWGVESLARYSPLAIERYHALVGMDIGGTFHGAWADDRNRALDLAAAQYVLTPDGDLGQMQRFERMPLPEEDLAEDLGSGHRASVTVPLNDGRVFTSAAMVSYLRESFDVAQSEPVLEMRFRAQGQDDFVMPLLAGRDTAELYTSCPSLALRMRHKPASIYKTVEAERFGEKCDAHFYFAKWELPARPFDQIDMRWVAPIGGIEIAKLILWNKATGDVHVVESPDFHRERFQWTATRERTRVYRNIRAMPRAWLVPEVIPLSADEVRRAIETGQHDPAKRALVEDWSAVPGGMKGGSAGTATITRSENTRVEIRTHSAGPYSFLVLSDQYYPGWEVSVNGRLARLLCTNYVQRGVVLPEGDNVVEFVFRPWSVYAGIAVALLSILAAAVLAWWVR
jgi:hypothetical protein